MEVTIREFSFVPNRLIAVANASVTVQVTNADTTTHSFGVYRDASNRMPMFAAVRIEAGQVEQVSFTSPERGSYILRCEIHPDRMTASFVAAEY